MARRFRASSAALLVLAIAVVVGCRRGGGSSSIGSTPGTGTPPTSTSEPGLWGTAFADMILETWPDPSTIDPGMGFQYNHGIVLHGIERIYEKTLDPRYLAYIQAFVDAYIGPDGEDLDLGARHDVDRIQPAILLPFLYEETGEPRYLTAADGVRDRYDSFPVNAEGGYWHKYWTPNELWLDTIYMTQPFLTRYGAVTDCGSFCEDTATFQIVLLAQHAQDPQTGLLRHGWDQDRNAPWADPATGLAPIVWSRGSGWYAMSLVDVLDDLAVDHPRRAELIAILGALAEGLRDTQDAATGLWHQVVDQGERPDNWIETSGSAMFVYALKRAVDRGYLAPDFLDVARRGWEGLKQVVATASAGGPPTLTGAVVGMGIQSYYAWYVDKPRLANSTHGLCAILMAASQMESYEPTGTEVDPLPGLVRVPPVGPGRSRAIGLASASLGDRDPPSRKRRIAYGSRSAAMDLR
ncbi:MAG: glycoside hydrolase family 88/105 protein [Alphaproteobacteria bacterium]